MPPNSAIEWIAGANVPRHRPRPRRRMVAEYETEDEDEEVEFIVKTNKKKDGAAKASSEKEGPDKKKEPETSKEPEKKKSTGKKKEAEKPKTALKPALKQKAASSSSPETSDSALSSDKEVETSGSEKSAASGAEESVREFDPECPCSHCVKEQKALRRARLGRSRKRVSFSEDDETDDSEDAETVHNFFKWNQAMEAKKAREKDAKDYKEFLAHRAKKEEESKKEAEKKKEEEKKEKDDNKKKDDRKKDDGKKKEEEKKKTTNGKGKEKENKTDSSSKDTTEASASEADTTTNGTDADSSGTESSQKEQKGSKDKSEAKKQDASDPPAADPVKSEELSALELLMKQLLKKKKKKKKDKSKKKREPKEMEREGRETTPIHPATYHDPNWLMSPQSNVVHVEHSMEAPSDPRPNAFYDNRKGVMRVYHGPTYGNPGGALYPRNGQMSNIAPAIFQQHGYPIDMNHNPYSGQITPRPYQSATQHHHHSGYPPPPSLATPPVARIGGPNGDQWFQGWGSTVVHGTPPTSQQDHKAQQQPGYSFHSRRFNGDPNGRPPRQAQQPPPNQWQNNTPYSSCQPQAPSASPGFDVNYFQSSNPGIAPRPAEPRLWGVQDAQNPASRPQVQNVPVNVSIQHPGDDLSAQMAKDLADIKASQAGWGKITTPSGPSNVQQNMNQPANSANNATQAMSGATSSGVKPAPRTTQSPPKNDNWSSNPNPTTDASNTWDNNGNNDVGGAQSSADWPNNNHNTSDTWDNNGNSGTNKPPNTDNWDNSGVAFGNGNPGPSQELMPGAWSSSPRTNADGGQVSDSAWADTNGGGSGTGADWGDAGAAQSSSGYWESSAAQEDADKAPAVAW